MNTFRNKDVHVDKLALDNSKYVCVQYIPNLTLGNGAEDCGFESELACRWL